MRRRLIIETDDKGIHIRQEEPKQDHTPLIVFFKLILICFVLALLIDACN